MSKEFSHLLLFSAVFSFFSVLGIAWAMGWLPPFDDHDDRTD